MKKELIPFIKKKWFSQYKKKRTFIILGSITVVISLLLLSIHFYNRYFKPNTNFNEDSKAIFIPTGTVLSSFKDSLTPLLKNPNSFIKLALSDGYAETIKPGKYVIKKGMNNSEILRTLKSKNHSVRVTFHSIETPEKLAGKISHYIEPDSVSLIKVIKDTTFIKEKNFTINNFMAMYIPNTYNLFWNTNAQNFRERMYKEYLRFWNNERLQKAEALGMTEEDIVTLASIVHRESFKVDERPRIAGVYINRLKKGMKLQADPTVIYAVRKQDSFSRIIKRVLYRHLKIDSPYNTYRHTGLPPGPIITPDITAIDAVLNYEKHAYIFFVANPENYGYHYFAKNLKQHNRNKKKYIKWLKEHNIH